jgi:hypothetical protein
MLSTSSVQKPSCDRFRHTLLFAALFILSGLLLSATGCVGCGPYREDISPDTPNGASSVSSTAGLTYAIAGDDSATYAVSLNAGVWKSTNGGAWIQLRDSPRYASAIAVDPTDISHIAVGERDGDASPYNLNRTGVWESRDAGQHWQLTFSPLTQDGCRALRTQAISAVAFSSKGTLFIGTACGIGRKVANQAAVFFDPAEQVTAIATSPGRVWARSQSKLLVGDQDGTVWTTKSIPNSIGSLIIGPSNRGDLYSLAAFDAFAYMPCCNDPTPPCGNLNRLLIYSLSSDSWLLQPALDSSGHPQLGCSGTGLGGRRFVKSYQEYFLKSKQIVGQKLELFYGAAQQVLEATAINSDGTVPTWNVIASAACAGCPSGDPIHSDIWDFNLAQDFTAAWVSNDGGVYRKAWPSGSWTTFFEGLHTHHAHTVSMLEGLEFPRLGYATQDNGARTRDASAKNWGSQFGGDMNWSAGDAGNPLQMMFVLHADQNTYLNDFKSMKIVTPFCLPNTTTQCLNYAYRPYELQFIQSLANENPSGHLDALLLIRPPLLSIQAGVVAPISSGPLAGLTSETGGPLLLRNKSFETSADINATQYAGWDLVANNLPVGTRGVVIANGHQGPIYFLFTDSSIYIQAWTIGFVAGLTPKRIWSELGVGHEVIGGTTNSLVTGGKYGPLFVNPFDADQILVLTKFGIMESTDRGKSFVKNDVLTSLVTDSGEFPITGTFTGGNCSGVPTFCGMGAAAMPMGTLAQVAFSRSDPKHRKRVVASPFSGIFYDDGDGYWRSLTPTLPHPLSPAASVQIGVDSIYVASEGRGIQKITAPSDSLLATYFVHNTIHQPYPCIVRRCNFTLATLMRSDGQPVSNATVHGQFVDANTGELTREFQVVTSTQGDIVLPFPPYGLAPADIVHLQFDGSNTASASQSAFLYDYQFP